MRYNFYNDLQNQLEFTDISEKEMQIQIVSAQEDPA